MRKLRLFSIAALALAMAACSSEENTLETQSPAAPGKLHFTATIATPDNGAGTRTEYSEQTTDGTINVAWKENDEIAAIVTNSEGKLVETVLKVSKVNTDGSATISGDITKPKDDALTVDLIYPASIVTIDDHGILSVSFDKMRNGTLDGKLETIAANIDYRMADDCALTVSGDKATLTSAAKLESELSIWKLTLQDKDGNALSASKVAIVSSGGVAVASATLATAGSTAYLPVPAATGDICISATTADNDYFYVKEGVTLAAKKYYQSTVQMTKGAHLAFLSADYEAKDGAILTGTLARNVKISIADGAAVTLKDVNINGSSTWTDEEWAGITCEGNATINLEGTNTVKGFYENYPGIQVLKNNTLTIQGTGSLTANGSYSAGIGGGFNIPCGNIVIKGGNITATGGGQAAGIGGGNNASCDNIEISGGTITATGGMFGAGIGGGYEGTCGTITINSGTVEATGGSGGAGIGGGNMNGTCGTITITSDVTKVKATAGESAPNSIGAGNGGTAISVSIGGTVYASGISTSPFEYSPIPATAHELSASVVGDVVGSNGKAYTLDATHVLPSGVTAVAIVAYKGSATGEASPYNHGLAIAMKDAAAGGKVKWSSPENDESLDNYTDYNPAVTTAQSGLSNSQTSGFDNESNYPAFYAALHNTITVSDGISAAAPASGTSGWFLPSIYQWNKIVQGLSGKTADLSHGGNANANYTASSLNPKIEAAGGTGLQSGYYWPSTEKNNTSAWYFTTSNGSVGYRNKTGEGYVRAVFAF